MIGQRLSEKRTVRTGESCIFKGDAKGTEMRLRPYQVECVASVWNHLRTRKDNPVFVIATGGGKTPCLAEICRQAVQHWNGRVLVLSHSRELVSQSAEKLRHFLPQESIGVHAASLNRRDLNHPVICGAIQSLYRRACDLGAFNAILIDECQSLPPSGEGMFRSFLKDAKTINPQVRLVGATATAYRTTTGELCGPDHLLNHICFEIGPRELIEQGYLSPLTSKVGRRNADASGLHVRGGEFVAEEAEALMDAEELVRSAVREIVEETRGRNSCLVFCAGVKHAEHVVRVFREDHGLECGLVEGNTPSAERARLIARFKREPLAAGLFSAPPAPLRFLANVNVLSVGFDAPNVDCVAMLRPTMSPGLMYQEIGRGFRLAPGKKDCLILDFAGNLIRHGPVDLLKAGDRPKRGMTGEAPAKSCPSCRRIVHASAAACPECGHEFPKNEKPKHDAHASAAPVISGSDARTENPPREYEVSETLYFVHRKKNAPPGHPPSIRVSHQVGNRYECVDEYVCPEHTGYARDKFVAWWSKRSLYPPPRTAAAAVRLAEEGGLARTKAIRVKTEDGFDRVIAWDLSDRPEPDSDAVIGEREREAMGEPAAVPAGGGWDDLNEDEIPF